MQGESMVKAAEEELNIMTNELEAMRDERDETRQAMLKLEGLFETLGQQLNLVIAHPRSSACPSATQAISESEEGKDGGVCEASAQGTREEAEQSLHRLVDAPAHLHIA